jgi:GT2 family glycosyltransferase
MPFLGPAEPPRTSRAAWSRAEASEAGNRDRAQLHAFLTSDARLRLTTARLPEVSVLLVAFNRAELTLACLRRLAEDQGVSHEVITVDNASTDETSLLLNRTTGLSTIHSPSNVHFVRAVNAAARKARGRHLLILNNDAEILPGAIAAAMSTLEAADDIGAVGSKVIRPDGRLQEAGCILWNDGSVEGYGRGADPFAPQFMFTRNVDYCSAAFLLTPRNLFTDLGGFDEAFAPAYYEDVDYCLRLQRRGLRVVYAPHAAIVHHESASATSEAEPLGLQLAHRATLVRKHSDALRVRLPPHRDSVLRARCARPNGPQTLLIDDRVPQPTLGSGFPRSRRLLGGLLSRGHAVTVYPTAVSNEDWAVIYRHIPRNVEVMNGSRPDELDAFFRERRGLYDSVIVSRPHNMQRLNPIVRGHPEWFRDTSLIYDMEALSTAREISRRRLFGGIVTAAEERRLLSQEAGLVSYADVVVAVSPSEAALLRQSGAAGVCILGHAPLLEPATRRHEERSDVLFVGAVHDSASPNADGMRWFVAEVLPLLRQELPEEDVTVTVAGFLASDVVRELATEGMRFVGPMNDLSSLYEASRVFVAPTRFGAGIPLKVLEAAGRGLPVVTTSLVARQLGWMGGEVEIADDAKSFARCVGTLYQNPDRWDRVRAAALQRVNAEWSGEVFDAQLGELLRASRAASFRPTLRR